MSELTTHSTTLRRRRRALILSLVAFAGLVAWFFGTEYYTLLISARESVGDLSSYALRSPSVDASREDDDQLYPEEVMSRNWVNALPVKDMTHLSTLHIACTQYEDSVIPWDMTWDGKGPEVLINETDPAAYEKLRECPNVDIYIPSISVDLKGRMILKWVLEKNFTDPKKGRKNISYHEMCPDTPILFMNHYWNGVRDDPKWPATKPMCLMPNIEMYELEASDYRKADVIICKTVVCDRYLRKWSDQVGNPTNTQVIYSRHTSSNLTSFAPVNLGDDAIAPKNFSDPKFVHVVGSSIFKATGDVLDCWLSRPDFPIIDIYIAEEFYNGAYKNRYNKRIQASSNIKVHPGRLDSVALGKIVAEAAFFMCPRIQEGYGHYLNQARAAGGLIVTTDIPPMNELITPKSGVVFHTKALSSPNQFLGGTSNHADGLRNVTGFDAGFNGNDICKAVDTVLLHTTPEEREKRAK
ncbi:hypothetical protein Poli38472_013207 [Pythium oligandrum]|uniref:Glycosyl transferase family 1 domain-containing protein n=1 Tax=Pythium oligandrum TaxID=41045 RepID=A0A8K1C2L5_PYTOL|nr:hypothetical protein Poli38472_013207 [Pythium oligandrum]|eukprot:TMW55316.1 hypothetical protein Poli38472_013207 [Pythium oligandrum]